VLPSVAKVVQVHELDGFIAQSSADGELAIVEQGSRGIPFRVRPAVSLALDMPRMQVGIVPAHCGLNDPVELGQAKGVRNQDAPPDLRLDVEQFDTQLVHALR